MRSMILLYQTGGENTMQRSRLFLFILLIVIFIPILGGVSRQTFHTVTWEAATPRDVVKDSTYLGRWFTTTMNGNPTMTTINQGSEIRTIVKDTKSIVANFWVDINSTYQPIIAYSVDGEKLQRKTVGDSAGSVATVVLATGLSAGQHTIKIVVAGIKETDPVWDKGAGIHFQGFSLDDRASILPWVSGKKKGLFIGDSITAGINVLGSGAIPAVNAGEQNYVHICCDLLNADPRQVGFGGTGIMMGGSGGVPQASKSCMYRMNGISLDEQDPDFIVINEGTNDLSQPPKEFKVNYQLFINQIKQQYPDIPVFIMRPFGGYQATAIQSVASATTGTYYVDTSNWGVTYSDGLHPDINGSNIGGAKLADFITEKLGISFFS